MYRKYYSYNDMPQPIYEKKSNAITEEKCRKEEKPVKANTPGNLFSGFANDDIILAVVILMLLINDCDDKLLLLALAFVFLSGFNN